MVKKQLVFIVISIIIIANNAVQVHIILQSTIMCLCSLTTQQPWEIKIIALILKMKRIKLK